MPTTQEITSLADFMDWVQRVLPVETELSQETQVLFYRGHADAAYQLMPSVYRLDNEGKSYRSVEYQLYQDMLHRNPAAFSEDKTLFERLVRMQHHGLPTRLLDVTQNPLVALFFACEGQNDKDGEMVFFYMPQSKVQYPPSIPQTALVGLESSLNLSILGFGIADSFRRYFSEINNDDCGKDEEFNYSYHTFLSNCVNLLATVTKFTDVLLTNEILKQLKQAIDVFVTNGNEHLTKKAQELQNQEQRIIAIETGLALLKFSERFHNQVARTIMNYCKQINLPYDNNWDWYGFDNFLLQFTYFYFVYPPLNNERILRQQGAFLIFPPVKSEAWTVNHFHKPIGITIKAEAKKKLLQELANMGVTRSYLFPELEEQAKDIKLRYPPTIENIGQNE